MKSQKLILISFCFVFSLSCKQSGKNDENDSKYVELLEGTKKIEILAEKEDLSHLISDDIEFIMLESKPNCIIGNVSKIILFDRCFFIYDNISKSVFSYDLNGNFLQRFSKEGKGPGEYVYLKDININKFNNTLEIYDRGTQNILSFDLDGTHKNTRKTFKFFDSFLSFGKDKYIFQVASDNPENKNFLVEKKGAIIDEYFQTKGLDNVFINNQITENNNSFFLTHGASNFIYTLKDENIKREYYIDFGKKNLPVEILDQQEIGVNDFFKLVVKDYNIFIANFYDEKDYLTFTYTNRKKILWAIYDKKFQKAISGNIKVLGLNISPPIYKCDSIFYSIIDSNWIKEAVQNCKEDDTGIGKKIKQLAKEIKVNDTNPIILKYKLVKNITFN